jgi:hypothetical protein
MSWQIWTYHRVTDHTIKQTLLSPPVCALGPRPAFLAAEIQTNLPAFLRPPPLVSTLCFYVLRSLDATCGWGRVVFVFLSCIISLGSIVLLPMTEFPCFLWPMTLHYRYTTHSQNELSYSHKHPTSMLCYRDMKCKFLVYPWTLAPRTLKT